MKKSAFFKLAASSFILGATMAGCSSTGFGTRTAAIKAGDPAMTADKAPDSDKAGKAIASAEAAVAASPNDGSYRSLLGQAYLNAGRFASAQASFEDAITLGHADARTVIGLAMVQIAGGRNEEARALLDQHMDVLPAADYGLAMALAGDTDEALRILSAEARQPGATAKVRQNFAYSLALAGHWRESKLIASQDLGPAEAARRMTEWAVLARPGAKAQQVASILGVAPAADAGMPVRLALQQPSAPAEFAQAAIPAPEPETMIPPAPAADTQIAMAPAAAPAPAFVPVAVPAIVPLQKRQAAPLHQAAPASGYVVQLGAFSSVEGVNRAWASLSGRYRHVQQFASLSNRAQVKGRTFHRLALSGFASRGEAEKLCASLKARGSTCFVRNINADAARWVSRDMMKLATRTS